MNAFVHRIDQIQEARELWQESEWRLGFLRSIASTPKPDPDEEEILKWFCNLTTPAPNWS